MTKLRDIIAGFVAKEKTTTIRSERKDEHASTAPSSPTDVTSTPKEPLVSATPNSTPTIQTPRPDESVEVTKDGIEVTSEFKEALELVKSGAPFVFITGRAGTGKSTFIELLKSRLNSFAIVAPTGVAALNVGGQTIHSFFKFRPGPIDFAAIKEVRNRTAFKALKTLIIDEVSMVRADMMDAIDLMLRKNGPKKDLPFGGVQVLAVGDLFQLPPIIDNEEESIFLSKGYQTPFFFGGNAFKDLEIKTNQFTKIFRQKEELFIALLNAIREGKKLDQTLEALNTRQEKISADTFSGIVLSGTNNTAARINAKRLSDIPAESMTFTGEITGEFRVDKNKLPAPLELELKVGAQVMFVKNDREKRWVNGTLGTIKRLGFEQIEVEIIDDRGVRTVYVAEETWDNLRYEYDADVNAVKGRTIGSYKQFPLTLAWAVTIHKSQGKTFDRVHINLSRGAFAEGQVYVALSRSRTLEGITLEKPLKREDIMLDYDVIQFYQRLSDNKVDS